MTEEAKSRLDKTIGTKKMYDGKAYMFKSYKEVNGAVVIFSDKRTFSFLPTELEEFLNEILIHRVRMKIFKTNNISN